LLDLKKDGCRMRVEEKSTARGRLYLLFSIVGSGTSSVVGQCFDEADQHFGFRTYNHFLLDVRDWTMTVDLAGLRRNLVRFRAGRPADEHVHLFYVSEDEFFFDVVGLVAAACSLDSLPIEAVVFKSLETALSEL
jgi:hypothetical protein